MLKFLAKAAEKYAKATNTACAIIWVVHQPKNASKSYKKRLNLTNLSLNFLVFTY